MIREYIVTKDILNIRSGPSEQANFRGQLLKGETVWLDDKEIIGITPLGGVTNIWLVYSSNDFVSKDGLRVKNKGTKTASATDLALTSLPVNTQQYMDERFDGASLKEPIEYNILLNIDSNIKASSGNNTVIGILDQPISTNIQFDKIIRPLEINTSISPDGHANFIAGIIAANSLNIKGISPLSTILELAIFDKDGFSISDSDFDKLINCLKSFNNKIIINVSRTNLVFNQHKQSQLQSLTNAIFVCSAGSDGKLNDIINNGCFLLNNPNAITITVGCVSNNFVSNISQGFQFDKDLDIILPILTYVSFNDSGQSFDKDLDVTSSYATAVISGIISLLFSVEIINDQSDKTAITNAVRKISKSFIGNNNFLNPVII